MWLQSGKICTLERLNRHHRWKSLTSLWKVHLMSYIAHKQTLLKSSPKVWPYQVWAWSDMNCTHNCAKWPCRQMCTDRIVSTERWTDGEMENLIPVYLLSTSSSSIIIFADASLCRRVRFFKTFNILTLRQHSWHFADGIFKCISLSQDYCIFLSKFHKSLFVRVQLTIWPH